MPQNMKAFIAAAAISFGLAGPIAQAQTTSSVLEPTAEQLDQYAAVAQQVALVAADYQPKLQQVKDDAERQRLMRAADNAMVVQVELGGLSVDEYNGISRAIQQDQALQKAVEQRIQSSK